MSDQTDPLLEQEYMRIYDMHKNKLNMFLNEINEIDILIDFMSNIDKIWRSCIEFVVRPGLSVDRCKALLAFTKEERACIIEIKTAQKTNLIKEYNNYRKRLLEIYDDTAQEIINLEFFEL